MKNNVRGSIIILEMTAIIIVAALLMRLKAGRDVFPPEISFPEGTASYTQGDDPQNLLSGVTALDDKDGDVTGSIIITSISVTGDGSAIAVYNAKDSSNNVAMSVRSVHFIPNEAAGVLGIPVNTEPAEVEILPDEDDDDQSIPTETDIGEHDTSLTSQTDTESGDTVEVDAAADGADSSDGDASADGIDAADGDTADDNTDAVITRESADSILASYENMDPDSYTGEDMEKIGAALRSETDAERASLPDGSPTIGLMAHAICQDIGSSLNPLDLIASIDDAEDSIDYIFGQIHVEGNAGFTTDYPGKYIFRYYVIDSDGNRSNTARLYIVVR